jgi:hypothetical protein
MRQFETGATRDADDDKFDYEGFLSPTVLTRYAEYMHLHRVQKDGKLRDSDNWQKGIPIGVYMKSLWRHFMDVWKLYRTYLGGKKIDRYLLEEALCACMFNVMGMLHEVSKWKTEVVENYPVPTSRWEGCGVHGGDLAKQYTYVDSVSLSQSVGLGRTFPNGSSGVPFESNPHEEF